MNTNQNANRKSTYLSSIVAAAALALGGCSSAQPLDGTLGSSASAGSSASQPNNNTTFSNRNALFPKNGYVSAGTAVTRNAANAGADAAVNLTASQDKDSFLGHVPIIPQVGVGISHDGTGQKDVTNMLEQARLRIGYDSRDSFGQFRLAVLPEFSFQRRDDLKGNDEFPSDSVFGLGGAVNLGSTVGDHQYIRLTLGGRMLLDAGMARSSVRDFLGNKIDASVYGDQESAQLFYANKIWDNSGIMAILGAELENATRHGEGMAPNGKRTIEDTINSRAFPLEVSYFWNKTPVEALTFGTIGLRLGYSHSDRTLSSTGASDKTTKKDSGYIGVEGRQTIGPVLLELHLDYFPKERQAAAGLNLVFPF